MTRVKTCDRCGGRERAGMLDDGVCRSCRGIDLKTPRGGRDYVSPDRYERLGESIDMTEQRARHRTLDGGVNDD